MVVPDPDPPAPVAIEMDFGVIGVVVVVIAERGNGGKGIMNIEMIIPNGKMSKRIGIYDVKDLMLIRLVTLERPSRGDDNKEGMILDS